jgi:peroxiredoxin
MEEFCESLRTFVYIPASTPACLPQSAPYLRLWLLLPVFWACSPPSPSAEEASGFFRISAEFAHCSSDSLGLYLPDGLAARKVAIAAIEGGGGGPFRWQLEGQLPSPGLYLAGQAPNNLIPVWLGAGEGPVRLEGNCDNLSRFGKVGQSALQARFDALEARWNRDQSCTMGMQEQALRARFVGDSSAARDLQDQAAAAYQAQKSLLDSLRKARPVFARYFEPLLMPPFDPARNPKGYPDALAHAAGELMAEADLRDSLFGFLPTPARQVEAFIQVVFLPEIERSRSEQLLMQALARFPAGSAVRKNALGAAIAALDRVHSISFLSLAERYEREFGASPPEKAYLDGRRSLYLAEAARERKLALGQPAPEIALPSPAGELIRLSSLRGKYVLIDFWASWCKPCRAQNPELLALYRDYKRRGFEILGVSLDQSRQAWLDAIRDDGLAWPQVSDLRFWQSEAAMTYNVSAIPASLLLDPQGRILAKNLRGASLRQELALIFEGSSD